MKYILLLQLFIFLSCKDSKISTYPSLNLDGYEIVKIDGSDQELAIKRNVNGQIMEQGVILNGVKNGVWITYNNDENNLPSRIVSYVDGKVNGADIILSKRGQIEEMSHFLNNQLHGRYGKYRFGRATITTEYKHGQYDGTHTEYFDNGNPQKIIEFKDGKQHGSLKYLDEEGNITLEYTYDKGEKVSGGIVN